MKNRACKSTQKDALYYSIWPRIGLIFRKTRDCVAEIKVFTTQGIQCEKYLESGRLITKFWASSMIIGELWRNRYSRLQTLSAPWGKAVAPTQLKQPLEKRLVPVLPEQEDHTAQAERSKDRDRIEPGPGRIGRQRRSSECGCACGRCINRTAHNRLDGRQEGWIGYYLRGSRTGIPGGPAGGGLSPADRLAVMTRCWCRRCSGCCCRG